MTGQCIIINGADCSYVTSRITKVAAGCVCFREIKEAIPECLIGDGDIGVLGIEREAVVNNDEVRMSTVPINYVLGLQVTMQNRKRMRQIDCVAEATYEGCCFSNGERSIFGDRFAECWPRNVLHHDEEFFGCVLVIVGVVIQNVRNGATCGPKNFEARDFAVHSAAGLCVLVVPERLDRCRGGCGVLSCREMCQPLPTFAESLADFPIGVPRMCHRYVLARVECCLAG